MTSLKSLALSLRMDQLSVESLTTFAMLDCRTNARGSFAGQCYLDWIRICRPIYRSPAAVPLGCLRSCELEIRPVLNEMNCSLAKIVQVGNTIF